MMQQSANHPLLWPFLVYGLAVVSPVSGMLLLSYFLGERHEEHATDEAYEGGILATGTARLRFPIHFYIIALFFVIFDVEAAFIFSWAIAIHAAGWAGYWVIVVFMGVSTTLLLYLWRIGALDFGPDSPKLLKAYYKFIKKPSTYEVVDKQGQ
jgi:NADH-quinone oxidoreductase subunit A